MEVPRVPPISPADAGLPAGGDRPPGGAGDLPFGPGQKLFAQVVQVLGEGRAVLDVGGERLIASTPLPVRNGEVLAVVVRRGRHSRAGYRGSADRLFGALGRTSGVSPPGAPRGRGAAGRESPAARSVTL